VNRECRHSHGLAEIFGVPLIISGMDKATGFKFCIHSHRVDRNKAHENFWKVAVGVVREFRKFSGHRYIGRIVRSSLR